MGLYENKNGVLSPIAGRGNIDGVYKAQGILGAKNLYDMNATSKTDDYGGVWTVNDDNTITVSGTPTDYKPFTTYSTVILPAGSYILSWNEANVVNVSVDTVRLFKDGTEVRTVITDKTEAFTFDILPSDDYDSILVQFKRRTNNVEMSGVIKPMIRLASDTDSTYVPYVPTNAKLNEEKMSYADNGVLGAKNLLKNDLVSQVKNGVTFTKNADDSITLSGTATDVSSNTWVNIYYLELKKDVLYTLSLGIDESSKEIKDACKLGIWNTTGGSAGSIFSIPNVQNKVTFRIPDETVQYGIYVGFGSTFTGTKTVYPMLRLASDPDDTYQPYAMTNKELTEVTTETLLGTLNQNDSFAVMKCGKIVTLVFTNTTWSSVKSLTLPAKYRPPMNIAFHAMIRDGNKYYMGVLTVLKTGVMNSYYEATYGADRVATPDEYLIYGTFTYIAN